MISIQELGLSILSDHPNNLYILGGSEYGVKSKYIEKLSTVYKGKVNEYPSMNDVIALMRGKHLIPLDPQLYIVRYDDKFVSEINEKLANTIKKLKIIGTVVCIYEDPKQINKIDKYLPEYVGIIESVNPKFIEKYLHSDFPKLDDRSIRVATQSALNYAHARNICTSMIHADLSELAKMDDAELSRMFGCNESSADIEFRKAIAGKSFRKFVDLLDRYNGQLDNIVYVFLQTMIDLEKVKTSSYADVDIKEYAKIWTIEDIYYMYMHAYKELTELRSNTSTNIYNSLVYLAGLFTFSKVPSLEAMKYGL